MDLDCQINTLVGSLHVPRAAEFRAKLRLLVAVGMRPPLSRNPSRLR